jgi:hypothetical protein
MPRVGFETTIPVFEWAKTVHALDWAVTVMAITKYIVIVIVRCIRNILIIYKQLSINPTVSVV